MDEVKFSNSVISNADINTVVFAEPFVLLDERTSETTAVKPIGNPKVSEEHDFENTKNKSYICPICGKGFGRNSHLKRHVKIHDKEKERKVRNTNVTDSSAVQPDTSADSVIPKTDIKSEIYVDLLQLPDEPGTEMSVGMSSGDAEISEDHDLADESTRTKSYVCPVCGKGFGRNSHLKRHVKIHDKEKGSKFLDSPISNNLGKGSIDDRSERSSDVANDQNNIWLDDDDEISESSEQSNHADDTCQSGTSQDERKFRCEVCDKTFLRKRYLRCHMKLHAGSEPHGCDKCQKRFSQASYLRAHLKTVHGNVGILEKVFDCSICSKSFGRMSHLKRHMKLHTGGPTFDCEECGKSFLQHGNLKAHVQMVHDKDRAFECGICMKRFPQRSNLNTHMRIHTGEKPFVCAICGRAFSQTNALKSHIITHSRKKIVLERVSTLERIFNCPECDKRFGRMSHLKRHVKLHLREATFLNNRVSQETLLDENEESNGEIMLNVDIKTNDPLEVNGSLPLLQEDMEDIEDFVKEEQDFDESSLDDEVTVGECT